MLRKDKLGYLHYAICQDGGSNADKYGMDVFEKHRRGVVEMKQRVEFLDNG